MLKIIILSKSLDENCLNSISVNTSSKKFEKGLVEALSQTSKVQVEVVNINNKACQSEIGKIKYYSFNSFIGLLKHVMRQNRKNTVMLTTGYHPVSMFLLLIMKIIGFDTFSYIYDTHRTALLKMSFMKRALVHMFYSIGFMLSKCLTGWLVLNDRFIKKSGLNINYLKTKVGVDLCSVDYRKSTDNKNIVFAGTLNSDNGIDVLLSMLAENSDIDFRFDIYGSGPLVEQVLYAEKNDSRVRYYGLIDNDRLNEELVNASYLLNLRNPNSLACEISFPSKLIEFMGTGTPVISNNFPGLDDEYLGHLHVVDNFTEISLANVLYKLQSDTSNELSDCSDVKLFIQNNNRWEFIVEDVISFINRKEQ